MWKRALLWLWLLWAASLWAQNPFGDGGRDPEEEWVKQREAVQRKCDALEKDKQLWRANWMDESTQETDLSKLAVELANNKAMSRAMLKKYLNDRAESDKTKAYNNVLKNLDIGRHQFLKVLFSRALEETNKRLRAKKLMALERACVINSGGTGNFARDIDVTVFAGDDARETTYFEAMRDVAKEMGLKVKTGPGGSVKNGIEIDDLEVAFHRGRNDPPDARYASDPVEFHLNYRRVVETQARNPEAYFGQGSDTEVIGRRFLSFKPGQTLVQSFEATVGGVRYTGQIASCMREARAILRGSNDLRIRRSQRAIHACNDYLQAWRHEQHGGGLPTQGALKYAARSLDELAAFYGFKNWMELMPEDRIQLLARMFRPGFLDEPGNREKLTKMAEALDTATTVLATKGLPAEFQEIKPGTKEKRSPEEMQKAKEKLAMQEHAAMAFLRDSCAAMAGAVAQEMLDPPMLDRRFLAEVNKHDHHWQDMNPAERDAYARHQDSIYKRCMSAAAMENLLVLVEQLKLIENVESKGARKHDTADPAIRTILASADPKLRPLLQAALDHAEGSVVLLNSDSTPEQRAAAEARMAAAREKLSGQLRKPAPGDEILGIAKGMSPRDFIRMQNLNKPPYWGDALEEMKGRMRKHIEDSFPENTYEATKRAIQEHGMKGYLAKRVFEETFQLGNVVDALTLVEMYQGDASGRDYAWFFTQNILGRCYWGLGFLMQAIDVRDKDKAQAQEKFKALGKNLVFDACARVIPGLMHTKIIFDIEKGLVMVTVGWAINQVNKDLIDALYTGPAGQLNTETGDRVGNRIRVSGFCVLDPKYVSKQTDKKTQQPFIFIDQPGLYQLYYKKWIEGPAGRELPYDELNTRPPIPGDPGKLLAAHDKLAKAVLDVGANIEPAWFGPRKAWQDKEELDKAVEVFVKLISPLCKVETDRVLHEAAAREFIQDGRDVIADGLQQRLATDILSGMIAVWQTHRLEMQYAKRQIQYMAGLADMKAMSEALAEPVTDGPVPKCDLEVDLNLGPRQKTAYTRYGSLPISCRLKVDASMPPNMKDIGINMEPLEFTCTNTHEYGKTTLAQVGIQKIKLTARANKGEGEVLVEKIVEVPLNIYPDTVNIAHIADTLSLKVEGKSDVRETFGEETRSGQYNQSYEVNVPYAIRSDKPRNVKINWSGDNFNVDYSEEIGRPYEGDDSYGPYTIKATINGKLDSNKRLLSFTANQTLVEKRSSRGELSRVTTTTVNFHAENVPADTFTGFGCDMALFNSSTASMGPKVQVRGKLTEHVVEYEEGKVRRESSKSAATVSQDGYASARFGVSRIVPELPGAPRPVTVSPIKINVK